MSGWKLITNTNARKVLISEGGDWAKIEALEFGFLGI